MSIFDTDILESKTINYKEKSFTVYEMSAYDRIHNIDIPADSDDPAEIKKNNYKLTESLLLVSLKPGYPDKTDEQIKQAIHKLPDDLLAILWKSAAEINHIPLEQAAEKEPGKKK